MAFVACNKDEEEEAFAVSGEAFYINRITDGELKTAVAFYAYANKVISSAAVVHPNGNETELENSSNLGQTWFKEPDLSTYTSEYPADGTYLFEVTSKDGVTLEPVDLLEIDSVGIPDITSTEYNDERFSYQLEWEEAENADAFLVKVLNEDEDIIFSGYLMDKTVTTYELTQSKGYWDNVPVTDETYVFQVYAYSFEEGASEANYINNIQEVSIAQKEIVWGE